MVLLYCSGREDSYHFIERTLKLRLPPMRIDDWSLAVDFPHSMSRDHFKGFGDVLGSDMSLGTYLGT